jgi:hypothetical protein
LKIRSGTRHSQTRCITLYRTIFICLRPAEHALFVKGLKKAIEISCTVDIELMLETIEKLENRHFDVMPGKQMCELKHGPYYYAYWMDHETKKLKKKYIGDHIPDKNGLNNDCNNDNSIF